jgi:hypothetical protein
MTNPNPEQAARILARQKLRRITTGDLPLSSSSLVDDIFLSLIGTHEAAITIINQIATQEFELIVTVNGELDLPTAPPQQLRHTPHEVSYQEPPFIPGVPPIEYARPYRRGIVPPKKGQE